MRVRATRLFHSMLPDKIIINVIVVVGFVLIVFVLIVVAVIIVGVIAVVIVIISAQARQKQGTYYSCARGHRSAAAG